MTQVTLKLSYHVSSKIFNVSCNLFPYYIQFLKIGDALKVLDSIEKRTKFCTRSNKYEGYGLALHYPNEDVVHIELYSTIDSRPSIIECSTEDALLFAKRLKIGIVNEKLNLGSMSKQSIKGILL